MPTKKTIALGLLGTVSIVAIFILATTQKNNLVFTAKNQTLNNIVALSSEPKVTAEPFNKDSDRDGLPNWEEKLRGTDPEKSDTDGDGASDGEEINLGRNPLIPGPNDFIIEQISKLTAQAPTTKKPVAPDTSSQTAPIGSQNKTTATDDENSPQNTALRVYGNALASTIKNFGPTATETNIVFTEIIKDPTEYSFIKLREIADKYSKLADNAETLKVPYEAMETHKALVQEYHSISDNIKKLDSDRTGLKVPTASFQRYSETAVALARALVAIINLFHDNKIVFSVNEAGSIFNTGR